MALVGFTRVLAVEGRKLNITANAIAPLAQTRMTEDLISGGGLAGKLGPEHVAPLVTYLCHESCESTGRIYSVGGGRVAEVFIGETPGYRAGELTPESIRDHWDDIINQDGYTVPRNATDETKLYIEKLR
jgi:hypothetical protein